MDNDLSKYLDQPTAKELSKPSDESEYLSLEEEIKKAAQPRTGLRNPYIKVALLGGGVMALLMVITSAFSGGPSKIAEAETHKDAEIKRLNKQLQLMGYKDQLQIAERQAKGYTQSVKPPVDQNAAKAKAEKDAIARNLAYRQQLARRSYQMPVSYSDREPTPVKAMPVMAPVAPKRDNSEILALRKELSQMQAKLTKQAEKPVEIASAELPPDPSDQGFQNVSNLQPVDGGAEETALMMGAPPVMIPAGLEAQARLDIGILASANGRVIATLSDSIKDSAGRVLIPKGSKLMGTASSDGEVVEINLEKAVVNGTPILLPGSGSIAVLKENKEPLIAKTYGGNNFWNILANSAPGGVSAGVNQLISPDTSSVVGNGFSQVTSQSSGRSLKNAGLAVLGGVFNGVSTSLQSEIQAGMQSNQTKIRGVKAGTRLRLVFIVPTPIVIPGIDVAQLPLG